MSFVIVPQSCGFQPFSSEGLASQPQVPDYDLLGIFKENRDGREKKVSMMHGKAFFGQPENPKKVESSRQPPPLTLVDKEG